MAPFISATDLMEYLEHAVDNDKAAIAVDAACDIIRDESDQSLDFLEDEEVFLDSEGTDVILLPEMPAISVASVVGPGDITLVEGTDWSFDEESGSITTMRRDYKFLPGRKLYTVVYTHGYTGDLAGKPPGTQLWPSSLRMLTLQIAARIYSQGIVSQESYAGFSATYSASEAITLTDRERTLLEKCVGVGRRR